MCYNCGGRDTLRDSARHLRSDHAAHVVDEEGDTEEESSDEGDVCGVEWECELNGTGDEDDDILGMGCESAEQSKWERLAAVLDSGAAENVLLAGVCNHVILSAIRRSDAGIGFRGAGGERIRNHGQRKFKVRMKDERRACGGNHMASGGREETAHVSGQDGRSREPCSPRQQGSHDSQTQGRCHSSAEGQERVRRRSLGSGKMQPAGGRIFTGRPESRSLPHR